MQIKKLAYLKIKIEHNSEEFCELYTFLKPTVLYLPYDLILKIQVIERKRICLIITSQTNLEFCQKVVLSLCDCNTKKVIVELNGCKTILCLKLCAINTLKPCQRCECNDCLDNIDDCYDKQMNFCSDFSIIDEDSL